MHTQTQIYKKVIKNLLKQIKKNEQPKTNNIIKTITLQLSHSKYV